MVRIKQLGESRLVSVRLPLWMVDALESMAKRLHSSRSAVIRELLVNALEDLD